MKKILEKSGNFVSGKKWEPCESPLNEICSASSLNERVIGFHAFLGGLSLHLNHLIAERMSTPYRQFWTLSIGIFLSNLVSEQLETSLMTSYCHF